MDWIDIVTQLVNSSLHLYIAFFFFSSFWKRKYSIPIIFFAFMLIDVIFTSTLLLLNNTILVYIFIYALTLLFALLFESKFIHKIIYVSIIYAINSVLEVLVSIAIQMIFSVNFDQSSDGALFIMGMLISKFVTFLVVLFIRLKKHKGLTKHFQNNYWGALLFPLSTLMMAVLLYMIFLEYPNPSKSIMFLITISYTILIFANMIIFDFIDTIYKNMVSESKVFAANELIAKQREQYQALINQNKNIMKIQHDNKNFYIGLISDLKNRNINTALDKLISAQEISISKMHISGNIIHSLVDIKKQAAKEKGIVLSYDYHQLSKIAIPATDLAIILGNALDNAIEACERIKDLQDKMVELFVSLKNNTIVIVIKNPVMKKPDISKLSTSKSDSDFHGFGIMSMKQIASNYGGEVLFTYEDNTFTTSIVLNNILHSGNE